MRQRHITQAQHDLTKAATALVVRLRIRVLCDLERLQPVHVRQDDDFLELVVHGEPAVRERDGAGVLLPRVFVCGTIVDLLVGNSLALRGITDTDARDATEGFVSGILPSFALREAAVHPPHALAAEHANLVDEHEPSLCQPRLQTFERVIGQLLEPGEAEMMDQTVHGRSVEAQVERGTAGGRGDAHKARRQTLSEKQLVNLLQCRLHCCRFTGACRAQEEQA